MLKEVEMTDSNTSVQRLSVVKNHLQSGSSITVSPQTALVDERVQILIRGLRPHQMVTVVADLIENKVQFESIAVFRADPGGQVDTSRQESLAGTYTGVDGMGLFWSLKAPDDNKRLIKKDVTKPMKFQLRLLDGVFDVTGNPRNTPACLAETYAERYYMKAGVKRIPLTTGRLRGTVFVPEGVGPFPAVLDMYGGVVSLIETRAALLASHGYAAFALTYLFVDHLPKSVEKTDAKYLNEALHWFRLQPYVDANRLGCLGLCFGGFLALYYAYTFPMIKAVININGICFCGPDGFTVFEPKPGYTPRSRKEREEIFGTMLMTREGLVINGSSDPACHDAVYIEAWQHGAKVLMIVGKDDKQVLPIHQRFKDACPLEYKDNVTVVHYEGAGHLIETPFTPLCRKSIIPVKRLRGAGLSNIVTDITLMSGGFPKEHAIAQEDSWKRILKFLSENV